jgi:malate dehydrogenase (oxaloacetate-decarboxylating)
VRGADYDGFLDDFIAAVRRRWPDVLLQWEDFATQNAGRLYDRYRDQLCTFNDDIHGTAAVAAGTLMAAIGVTGVPLAAQRIAILGAGTAGCGIASLLLRAIVEEGVDEATARQQFYAIDRDGLLVEGMPGLRPAQAPFVRSRADVAGWRLTAPGRIDLPDVVENARPTTLIGVSGQAGAFTEAAIRRMAAHVERPVIFPLSNPTSSCEATPAHLTAWTDGRALIGTGSPFPPVEHAGRVVPVNQTNNSYVFPGVGLGVLAAGARRVTDAMFMAAARALAALSPARKGGERLLPPVDELRAVAIDIAAAVARQAQRDGVAAPCDDAELERRIRAQVWEPVYRQYRRV